MTAHASRSQPSVQRHMRMYADPPSAAHSRSSSRRPSRQSTLFFAAVIRRSSVPRQQQQQYAEEYSDCRSSPLHILQSRPISPSYIIFCIHRSTPDLVVVVSVLDMLRRNRKGRGKWRNPLKPDRSHSRTGVHSGRAGIPSILHP